MTSTPPTDTDRLTCDAGDTWLPHQTGYALSFLDGVLNINRDGSGSLAFREDALEWEETESGDYRYQNLPASELLAIRDALNARLSTPTAQTERSGLAEELVRRASRAVHEHLSRRDIMQYLDNDEDCRGVAQAVLTALRSQHNGATEGDKVLRAIDVKAERRAFEAWWRSWCPDAAVPSSASHIFDAWLASARAALSTSSPSGGMKE